MSMGSPAWREVGRSLESSLRRSQPPKSHVVEVVKVHDDGHADVTVFLGGDPWLTRIPHLPGMKLRVGYRVQMWVTNGHDPCITDVVGFNPHAVEVDGV